VELRVITELPQIAFLIYIKKAKGWLFPYPFISNKGFFFFFHGGGQDRTHRCSILYIIIKILIFFKKLIQLKNLNYQVGF